MLQTQFLTVPRLSYRIRRLVTLVAAALVLGVAAHGACQAINHHNSVKDVVALCAAALALVATLRLVGGTGRNRPTVRAQWLPLSIAVPSEIGVAGPRSSAAWLQRFRN